MSDLPSGWGQSALVDLIGSDGLFSDGDWVESKDQDPNGANRLLQLADIGDGRFLNKSNRFVNDEKFELLNCTEVLEDDVLVARMPDPLGRTCLMPKLPQRCLTVVDVAIVRPGTSSVFPNWLMHFLNSPAIRQEIQLLSSGTTRRRISRGNLAKIELPIPPLNEQKRIAEKLDSLFARVDSCHSHLERVPQILKRFRQSVLAKAISGELTEDWRESETTEDWDFERAEDVCEKVQSGGTPREGFIDEPGVPFLKVYNIVDQKIDFDYRSQYITREIHKGTLSKSQTKPGDVLMNIVGPPLGKVAVVPDNFSEWNINQAITLFRPGERIISKWIYYFLCSGFSIAEIIHETRGSAGQSNISLSQCRNFVFPVPPVEEQMEIVRRVENLFAYVERLDAHYQSASERVEQLTASLLAKSFRGELVEQDPNDEPTEILLERIRSERVMPTAKAKRATKSQLVRETKMPKSLEEIIRALPADTFSFDDLREKFSGDYETLKEELFRLLSDKNPIIHQVFDKSSKSMGFVRRNK